MVTEPSDAGEPGETARELAERFDMRPVAPSELRARFDAGERLVTMDLQGHLGRKMVPEVGTGTALYRLVRLVTSPGRWLPLVALVAYVAAGVGVALGFLGGFDDPMSTDASYGIALLAGAFVLLFYVSVSLSSYERG